MGKDVANPMAMILANAAVLHYGAQIHGVPQADQASRAIYEAVLEGASAIATRGL
jgi:isocitrate/isopropylmalate dehydrogenase